MIRNQLALMTDTSAESKSTGFAIDLENVGDKNYLTHNLHPYPAKFIPQIPAAILDRYAAPQSKVLDPFCGSGTVAVEAALRGHTCWASDLNPIATLITRTKTARLTGTDSVLLNKLLIKLRKRNPTNLSIPEFRNIWHWFTKEMALELNTILEAIDELPKSSAAHQLALAALSAIIVKCSKQESDTRWVAVDKDFPRGMAFQNFEAKLGDALKRLAAFNAIATGQVFVSDSDARSLCHLLEESIDIVITSPPYLNSFDYYLYHKLRMFWLGYDHHSVQEKEIGSRNKHCDNNAAVEDYFSAMGGSLGEIQRVMRPGSIAAIVIGDSVYKGALIDMGAQYRALAEDAGLRLEDSFTYDQRRYTSAFNKGFKTIPKKSHILIFSK